MRWKCSVHKRMTMRVSGLVLYVSTLLSITSLHRTVAEEDRWQEYDGDDNFYSFWQYGDVSMDWDNHAIKPESCFQ